MKNLLFIPLFAIFILFDSCKKCELIDQEIVFPGKSCTGTFYFSKINSAMDTTFTFNKFDKPILSPLNPTQLAGPFGLSNFGFDFRTNFSAYDSLNDIYVFEFFNSSGNTFGFYSNQLGTNISTHSNFIDSYVSPVFQEGRLFVIQSESFGADLQYSIGEINPITGQEGVSYVGDLITTNHPPYAQFFTSASGKIGLIYFLGGTYLIEYNRVTNTTRYFDIDPSFDPIDNPVDYFGLEYDPNQDLFYCMKSGPKNINEYSTTLISIKVLPTGVQLNHVFDIDDHLPSGHSSQINIDFFSTAFDACDTTYYITELKSFDPLLTTFIEVKVNRQSLSTQEVQGLYFGLEYVPSK